jgi:TonB-linked SusC/RagA family outer membrane protein
MKTLIQLKCLLLIAFILACSIMGAEAQQTVTGMVTDAQTGDPLPGVNILVMGTSTGTATDTKGHYSLQAESVQDTLRFSFIGYKTKTVPIDGRTTINVALEPTIFSGQQMVVIGYGTQKKSNLTGSVATISGTTLQQAPVANVSNTLEGRLPGVIVNTRTGEAGSASSVINIRGEGTLNNNSPLIVIDGVPRTMSDFDRLNPSDIKSISVLKDASAAIYGVRSANGVILVTTKEGKIGAPQITYHGTFGYTQPTRVPKFVTGWQYMKYENEKDINYDRPTEYSKKTIEALKNGTANPRQYANTDWESAVIKEFSPKTTHQLSISGGSQAITYFLSGQYLYRDGIFHKSANYYHQGNLRANFDINVTKNIDVSLKASEKILNKHYPNLVTAGGGNIWVNTMAEYPFLPVFYPNGDPSGTAALSNPVMMAEGRNGFDKEKYHITSGILSINLKLPQITKGLYLKGTASVVLRTHISRNFHDQFPAYSYDPTTDTYTNTESSEPPLSLNRGHDKRIRKDYTIKLGYKRGFGPNNIKAFVAYEQSSFNHTFFGAYRQGFLSDQLPYLSLASSELLNNFGGADYNGAALPNGYTPIYGGTDDIFGRVSYNYKGKYLADFTLRHDGSFRFPPGHRWGTFPSASVGWRISQEPFFSSNIISGLKLRASWGELGNDQIAPFQFVNLYSFGSGYEFGATPSHYRGFVSGVAPNPNITWEVADKKDIGVNMQFLNGLLRLTADYFIGKRSNILIPPNGTVPGYTGLTLPDENIGEVKNHGIEGSVTLQKQKRAFTYKLTGNITFARNKIAYIDESPNIPSYQRQTGHPMDSYLLYKADGIYHNQQQIDNSIHLPGTKPGDIRYVDVNGDDRINADDRIRIYQNATPEIQYGFDMSGGYKNLHIRLLWQGQTEAKQSILPNAQNKQFIPPLWIYEGRWTPSNPNAKLPLAFDREDVINNRPSTFWLRNAWFLRLKTVRISYALPQKLLSNISLDKVQFYVAGQNLFVISAIKHYDPELNNSLGQYYPQVRTFVIGLSLKL